MKVCMCHVILGSRLITVIKPRERKGNAGSTSVQQANKAVDCSGKELNDGSASMMFSNVIHITFQLTYLKQPSNKAVHFACLRTTCVNNLTTEQISARNLYQKKLHSNEQSRVDCTPMFRIKLKYAFPTAWKGLLKTTNNL